jgi:hypothetical protein
MSSLSGLSQHTRLNMLRCATISLALCSGFDLHARAQDSDSPPPPPSAAPTSEPPPPPEELPTPPEPQAGPPGSEEPSESVEAQEPIPEGQWVFTNQYGWVFMPYAQTYTYVPATGYPFMFAYGPRYGWRWLSAPWIYGVGPHPYWGTRGYAHFAWHAHPWFASGAAHRGYVHAGGGAHRASFGHEHFGHGGRRR